MIHIPNVKGGNEEAEEWHVLKVKTLSAVVQEALRSVRATRLKEELHHLQGYWSRKQDLDRYLQR